MKPIKTWDEVDTLLLNLYGIDSIIQEEKNIMIRECEEIKARSGDIIRARDGTKKEILEIIESFFIAHEDDSEVKGKTYEGICGKCGLRMTPPSVKPVGKTTWERVLNRILDLGYKAKLLRPLVHSIKDIDRELLASDRVSDEIRKEIGVKIHQEERFWYEIK